MNLLGEASFVFIEFLVALASVLRSLGRGVNVISHKHLVSPGLALQLVVSIAKRHGVLDRLFAVHVEGLSVVSYGIGGFLREPAALGLPALFQICLRWQLVIEVGLGHGAHISVLERRVEAVDGVDIALGTEVNVGKAALVGALLAHVHLSF